MNFEWDGGKSDQNLRERGFGFDYATYIFDGPTIETVDDRHSYGEIEKSVFVRSAKLTKMSLSSSTPTATTLAGELAPRSGTDFGSGYVGRPSAGWSLIKPLNVPSASAPPVGMGSTRGSAGWAWLWARCPHVHRFPSPGLLGTPPSARGSRAPDAGDARL